MANNYFRHINPQNDNNSTPNAGRMPRIGEVDPGFNPPTGEVDPGFNPPAGEVDPGFNPPIGEVDPGFNPPPAGLLPPIGEIDPGFNPPPAGLLPPISTLPAQPVQPAYPTYPINTIYNVFRNCMNGLVYVWMRNGDNFWMFPTGIQNNRVYGYRYNQQAGWLFYDFPLSAVLSVTCVQRF